MKRWVIIGAADIKDYDALKSKINKSDYIVAADGGQKHLVPLGIEADLYLGDYDSSKKPETTVETLVYPIEKDDTDTMLALKKGIATGCKSFMILGGMGGRFDHTFANIQALLYAERHGASAILADENNFIFVLKNDTAVIENNPGEKVSLFALDGAAHGITLEGFYYSLQNGTLYSFDPMGTSNYIIAPQGKITVKKGTLLVVISKENQ